MGDSQAPCFRDKDPPVMLWSNFTTEASSQRFCATTDLIRPCFHEPFGEGSRRTPASLTPLARVLDAIVRRTLLLRLGYKEGLTHMQLWVVHHLMSQTPFDIWDLMLCEMEDTLAEGFKGHRQLPYAHWICFLIRSACDLPAEIRAKISDTTTAFPEYDIR
jgi:hypothetical protein